MSRTNFILFIMLQWMTLAAGSAEKDALVRGGVLHLPFRAEPGTMVAESVHVRDFRLDKRAVNAVEFLEFLRKNPVFQRSKIESNTADEGYLKTWPSDLSPPPQQATTPVTAVSWYAAKAYCRSVGKRLPTTAEWEWASASRLQGQGNDSAAHERIILEWYSSSSKYPKGITGAGTRHAYGIRNLHGLIWEWTADFNAWNNVGVNKRGRVDELNDPASGLSCGGAPSGMIADVPYSTYMRWAFRASLKPNYTVATLGFRCAGDDTLKVEL